jgi:hypothetical protein
VIVSIEGSTFPRSEDISRGLYVKGGKAGDDAIVVIGGKNSDGVGRELFIASLSEVIGALGLSCSKRLDIPVDLDGSIADEACPCSNPDNFFVPVSDLEGKNCTCDGGAMSVRGRVGEIFEPDMLYCCCWYGSEGNSLDRSPSSISGPTLTPDCKR